MLHPEINWEIYQACAPCLARKVCKPHALIQIDLGEPPYIGYERCTNCAHCALACDFGAINMVNHSLPNYNHYTG